MWQGMVVIYFLLKGDEEPLKSLQQVEVTSTFLDSSEDRHQGDLALEKTRSTRSHWTCIQNAVALYYEP